MIMKMSRRSALRRLAGLALASGGLGQFVSACAPFASGPAPARTSTPKPSHIALGSLLYTYQGHSDYVDTVAWSPDSQRIASGGFDNTVQVWNALDGSDAYIFRRHTDAIEIVAWSPEGKRLAS